MGINNLLSSLPEYEHGEFDHDNTLHITVAEKTAEIFDKVWPLIASIPIVPMTIPVKQIDLYRKYEGGVWEKIKSFPILKN